MSARLHQISQSLPKNRLTELRKSSQINTQQLFNTIFSSKMSKYFEEIYSLIRENPKIFQHHDLQELSKQQTRDLGRQQMMLILTRLGIDMQNQPQKFVSALYILSHFSLGSSIKGLVHYLLYIKSILTFQSNEYHVKCMKNQKVEDFGSFSLTQLHHGSFSQGIATTAIYDHNTRQFIVSTQGEKGMKFWIGNLANDANKTILWAQLIVDGVNYGPHPFLMRVRDAQTHQVLPGIIIGDCGPKNGLNAIDNGYMIVDNVRIPAQTLLGKLGWIDQNGKYQSVVDKNSKRFGLHMSPLSFGRATISIGSLTQSTSALAIGLRFACARRQFKTTNDAPEENLIIDYPVVRFRLLLPLATNVVFLFGGFRICELFMQNAKNFTDPTKDIIAELHAISAVLKVRSSSFAGETITECRELLAGHGYSSFSRLGSYYNDNDINATWEGDNNMLLVQTFKFLLKAISQGRRTQIVDLSFVSKGIQKIQINEDNLNDLGTLRIMLRNLLIKRFMILSKQMLSLKSEGQNKNLSKSQIQTLVEKRIHPFFGNQLALTYGDLVYFETAYSVIQNINDNQANKNLLQNCLRTWIQSVLLKASVQDIQCRKLLQTLIVQGCDRIYPDSVSLVDTITPPSFVLGSPFAQEDGEGMKTYLNMIFTSKKAFGRVQWFDKVIKMRDQN